jgi:hypothetical protein
MQQASAPGGDFVSVVLLLLLSAEVKVLNAKTDEEVSKGLGWTGEGSSDVAYNVLLKCIVTLDQLGSQWLCVVHMLRPGPDTPQRTAHALLAAACH